MKAFKRHKAFSVIELIVAVTFVSFILASVGYFSIEAARSSQYQQNVLLATSKIQEDFNAILANKQDLWYSMVSNTNDGPKHIVSHSNNSPGKPSC